jgi:hypothetical protein
MGGFGSGRWYKCGSKTTTESQRRIDIRWFRRQGYLNLGHTGKLSWSRAGETTGWISYRMESDRMVLDYRFRPYGGKWKQVEQQVFFDRTRCHFGGHRTWFLCSRLPGVGEGWWLSMVQRNTSSAVTVMTSHIRSSRKASWSGSAADRKIRKRLGGSHDLFEPLPGKPKNTHWATYWKLREEADGIHMRWRYSMKCFPDTVDRRLGIKR